METRQQLVTPSSEFDNFLFAVICEERGGAQLSVLSALVRADIDPWEEAARLSTMSAAAAEEAVASLIDGVTHEESVVRRAAIAERLVRLLPRRAGAMQSESVAALSRVIKADLSTQALIFLVGWWSFVMVVSAFTPNKARMGADAPPAYATTIILPHDHQASEASAVIRDGFPYSNVRTPR